MLCFGRNKTNINHVIFFIFVRIQIYLKDRGIIKLYIDRICQSDVHKEKLEKDNPLNIHTHRLF